MNGPMNKKMIARAVAICIAMGSMPAFAQSFDPPGSHTWRLKKASNAGVTTDNGRVVGGVTDLLYGRDFLIGGKGSISWTSTKLGYIPLAVGDYVYSCPSGTTTCTAGVSYSNSSCHTQQTTYGITGSADVVGIVNLTITQQTVYTHRQCSSSGSYASINVSASSISGTTKAVALIATGYKNGTSTHTSNKIFWSPSIKASSNDQNITLWTKVYNVCKALGWSAPTTHWSSARDVVKQTGFCYLGTSKSLQGTVEGAHPSERIASYPILAETATRVVGTYYATSAW